MNVIQSIAHCVAVDCSNKARLWIAAAGDEQDPAGEWKCQGGSKRGSTGSGGVGCQLWSEITGSGNKEQRIWDPYRRTYAETGVK